MESHLPDKYRHLCSYCGKAFHKLLAFKAHIMYEHTGERPYQCDICNNCESEGVFFISNIFNILLASDDSKKLHLQHAISIPDICY